MIAFFLFYQVAVVATLTAVQFEIAALDLVPVNVVEDESEGGVTETVKVEEESLRIKMLPVVVNTWPFVNATRKGWFVVIVFFFFRFLFIFPCS